MSKNKTQLIDISKKTTTWNKSLEIYNNGEDNQYPERIDRFINNSVTAKTACNVMIQYLLGKGFGENDNFIVNKNLNLKLIDFADDLANSKVKQRGIFIHVNWNANYNISSMQVLPFGSCRIGKKDDKNYNGKILVHKDWLGKIEDKDVNAIDVYNSDKLVIESQVAKAGGWDKYKGQILYLNDDNEYYYPLSRIDVVQLDCDNENLISVYKNRILRKGFFGKTLILTRPLVDSDIEPTILDGAGALVPNPLFQQQESERDAFKGTVKDFLGAENADGVFHMELDFEHENLENAIVFKNIESNIDPSMFEKIEASIRKNILIAINNLPVGLIESSEGVFQNSADSLKEMKLSFWENTYKERDSLETIVNDLLRKFEGYSGDYLQIKPLIEQKPIQQ